MVEPVVVLASDEDALLELAKALPRTMNSGDYMYPTVYFSEVFNLEGTREDMYATDGTLLYIGCTIGTVVVFVIIYVIVYLLTARAYYRIVNTVDAKA